MERAEFNEHYVKNKRRDPKPERKDQKTKEDRIAELKNLRDAGGIDDTIYRTRMSRITGVVKEKPAEFNEGLLDKAKAAVTPTEASKKAASDQAAETKQDTKEEIRRSDVEITSGDKSIRKRGEDPHAAQFNESLQETAGKTASKTKQKGKETFRETDVIVPIPNTNVVVRKRGETEENAKVN